MVRFFRVVTTQSLLLACAFNPCFFFNGAAHVVDVFLAWHESRLLRTKREVFFSGFLDGDEGGSDGVGFSEGVEGVNACFKR